MRIDMHVHTDISVDSQAKMEKYIEVADKNKVGIMCFTDHVDNNPNDYGYQCYDPLKYFEKFRSASKYNYGRCKLLSGIEFSEPHLYEEQLKDLHYYPFDYIIGSIHWIGDMFPCKEVREKYSAKAFYQLYWQEVLNTVRAGGFDCLGHFDFPKRYYGNVVYEKEMIKQIFYTMVEKGIVLEINTSAIRKGLSETMPGIELLELYKECGGRYVTTGSDAHMEEDLAADFTVAEACIAKLGLNKVYFENRKMVIVEE